MSKTSKQSVENQELIEVEKINYLDNSYDQDHELIQRYLSEPDISEFSDEYGSIIDEDLKPGATPLLAVRPGISSEDEEEDEISELKHLEKPGFFFYIISIYIL